MGVVAGVLGLLFAALHGAIAPDMLRAPAASRGSGDPGAIPPWARLAWAGCVALTAIGAVLVVVSQSVAIVAALAVGVVGVALLAVANGVWMKGGRPTPSHHVVRGAFAVAVLVPAVLSLD